MAAQRSSVQFSPVPHISHSVAQECTELDRTFIRILRFASLHLRCFPLVFCSALLCCCSCSFVIYVASLAFSWLPSMLVYCCWRGFCCCYCCLWQGRICCYCCCYCYLPIDCTLQRTVRAQSALVMRGQFVGSTYQEVSQFHCSVPSIV